MKDLTWAYENSRNALKPDEKILIMPAKRHNAYDIAEELVKQSRCKVFFKKALLDRPHKNDHLSILCEQVSL